MRVRLFFLLVYPLVCSLERTQFLNIVDPLISSSSTVHVHPPRRVRESRVVAVTIAAADIVIVLL